MIFETPIVFHSQGVPLVGRFLRTSESLLERKPAVLVMGSWLTVKEQMATTYGRRLAELGYVAFIFDFSGFGESRGEPRQAEIPARKIEDILAAVEFLGTVSFVDPARIGCLAICASAQYTLAALARAARIRSFASVAGWYHEPASLAPFYGGDAGIALRLGRARAALERYAQSGEVVLAPRLRGGQRPGRNAFPARLLRPLRSRCGASMAQSNGGNDMAVLAHIRRPGGSRQRRDALAIRAQRRLRFPGSRA
jgi:uncharacterized protein